MTACAINCYAVLNLTISTKKLDRATRLGISVIVSLAVTICVMIFKVVPWDEINLFLLAGITGIGYTSVELTALNKSNEVFVIDNRSILDRQRWSKVLLMFLKNVGIVMLVVLCLILIISLLRPKNIF